MGLFFAISLAVGLTLASFSGTPSVGAVTNVVIANCTSQGLADAMNTLNGTTGGTISFNCDNVNASATITITQAGGFNVSSNSSYTIDGGNVITLTGAGTNRIFRVFASATLTVTNLLFVDGFSATDDGGAIRNDGTLSVDNSQFSQNQTDAAWSGGAIVSYGPLNITNSEFANIKAGNGGALYPRFSTAPTLIIGSSFHDNQTTNTTSGWGGAMLLWDGAPVTITQSTVSDNTALNRGGAVYVEGGSSLTIRDSQIYSNTAANGDGGGLYLAAGTATLDRVTVSGNNTKYAASGGGIYNVGTITLTNSTLSGNKSGDGGGIFNWSSGIATLAGVTVSGNSGLFLNGGGILNEGLAALANVTLSGNSASFAGGGIHNNGSISLINVTLNGNSSLDSVGGGGLFHYGAVPADTFVLKNTIVANSPSGGNCYQNSTSVTSITSNGFNLSSDRSCQSFFNQPGDVLPGTDPLLGPLANNGGPTLTHMPSPPSQAIDAIPFGTNGCGTTINIDQRGAPRPINGKCDIGAVEYGWPWPQDLVAAGREAMVRPLAQIGRATVSRRPPRVRGQIAVSPVDKLNGRRR